MNTQVEISDNDLTSVMQCVFQKQKYNDSINNSLFFITSGCNNWSELRDIEVNNFNIKYDINIKKIIDKIESYQLKKNPLYKTKWLNDSSTVILNYEHNHNVYNLKLTLLQASILLLFENEEQLTFDKIYKSLIVDSKIDGTKKQCIANACKSLVVSKILCNENRENIYKINNELKLTDQYIKKDGNTNAADIAKFYFKMAKNEKPIETVQEIIIKDIEYDRMNTLKCYIIKYVKRLPEVYHAPKDIYKYINSTISIFKFTNLDIDSCITSLTKGYYLENKRGQYKYEKE